LIALSLVSLAASLVLRGLWGGPWLMEIKAFGRRIEAGNMLGLFTLALIAGPVLMEFSIAASAIAAKCWPPRIALPRCCWR
jgi:hypothetical protein